MPIAAANATVSEKTRPLMTRSPRETIQSATPAARGICGNSRIRSRWQLFLANSSRPHAILTEKSGRAPEKSRSAARIARRGRSRELDSAVGLIAKDQEFDVQVQRNGARFQRGPNPPLGL